MLSYLYRWMMEEYADGEVKIFHFSVIFFLLYSLSQKVECEILIPSVIFNSLSLSLLLYHLFRFLFPSLYISLPILLNLSLSLSCTSFFPLNISMSYTHAHRDTEEERKKPNVRFYEDCPQTLIHNLKTHIIH